MQLPLTFLLWSFLIHFPAFHQSLYLFSLMLQWYCVSIRKSQCLSCSCFIWFVIHLFLGISGKLLLVFSSDGLLSLHLPLWLAKVTDSSCNGIQRCVPSICNVLWCVLKCRVRVAGDSHLGVVYLLCTFIFMLSFHNVNYHFKLVVNYVFICSLSKIICIMPMVTRFILQYEFLT